MDQQSFRFYIPGIIFLIPIYAIACWITINISSNPDIRTFVLIGGITVFPAIAFPVGWLIFHSYTVLRLFLTGGRYEDKDFVKLVKKDTKPFYSPSSDSFLIDFSHVENIGNWLRISPNLFRKLFYPHTTSRNFYHEISIQGINTKYNEHFADLVTMKYIGREYLKSISSIRYGLESGLFALIIGSLYAVSIHLIWSYGSSQPSHFVSNTFGIALFSILTIGIVFSLIVRWRQADKEYDARLILHVLASNKSNSVKIDSLYNDIPNEIFNKLDILSKSENSYAAFDLDNTLLIGDIGHAVFATLVNRKLVKGFGWTDYINMRKVSIEKALKKIVEVMNGLKISTLKSITEEIIESKNEFIEIEGVKIRTPRPNLIMASIITFLRTRGIDVYVVTASNKISADIICWKYFGIASVKVFGSETNNRNGKIYFSKNRIIPFAEGKVKTLKEKIKGKPIVTGGMGSGINTFWTIQK